MDRRSGRSWCRVCITIGVGVALTASAAQAEPPRDRPLFPDPVQVPRDGRLPIEERVPPAVGPQRAAQPVQIEILEPGASSAEAMQQARERMPWNLLEPSARRRALGVVNDAGLFRRLPTIQCRVDARVYDFFATHPDVAVSLWRAMGISRMQMWQTGPLDFECDLQDGTFGALTVLHREADRQIVLCEGQFQSPLLAKPITATGLMHLQTRRQQDEGGGPSVVHAADVFVTFSSQAVESIARLISPVSFRMADRNFEEVTLFLALMDVAMSEQPGWVEQMAGRLDGVLAGADEELLEVTAEVYVDARRRALEQAGGPVSIEAIRPPVRQTSAADAERASR